MRLARGTPINPEGGGQAGGEARFSLCAAQGGEEACPQSRGEQEGRLSQTWEPLEKKHGERLREEREGLPESSGLQ